MSKVLPEKWIQTKVTVGFVIIIAIAIVIFTISYFSVVSIVKVQNESVDHNEEFTILNQLIFEIIETEGVSRMYGVTGDSIYANEYLVHHDSILAIINLLPMVFDDTTSISSIEKVKELYLQKKEFMDELQKVNIINLHSSGTENLLSSIPDSLDYEVTQYTYTTLKIDTLQNVELHEDDLVEKPQKRKGFLKSMSDFLVGKKKKDEDDISNESVVSQQMDSVLTKQVRADQNMQLIKSELKKVTRREELLNKSLLQHENDLIKLDRLLTEQIKLIVSNLQEISISKNIKRRQNLESLRSDMIDRILMLVGSAVFLMLFFIYWISRDIAKSQQLKNELIRAKERVDKLLKVKEQFVAHMSHEIRTPLTSIIGFSEQLCENNSGGRERNLSDKIRLSAEHLKGLVNNILDFSLLESGSVEFYKDNIDAETMMHDIYQLFELSAQKSNLKLEYQVDSNLEIFVSDNLRLKQVLINLIGNAIKFTHEGSVLYKVDINKEKLIFTVQDTGIGIPRDKQKTIFKMFNQVNISLSRKYSGTGLGLSISRQIIEAMGGHIQLNSIEGKGSIFVFDIPYVKGELESVNNINTKEYDFLKYQISAIDDDEMICQLIDGILHKKLSRLDINTSSELALQAIGQVDYDLFMVDLHMPGRDGLQIMKVIREDKKLNTPILFLTADMVNSDLKHAVKEDDNIWFLSKPFTQNQLFSKLDNIFNRKIEKNMIESMIENENTGLLFSLDGVKSFTGNDLEFLKSIVNSFIENTEEGIASINKLLTTDDFGYQTGEKAHKMLTGFRQFQAKEGCMILEKLESCRQDCLTKEEALKNIRLLEEIWTNMKKELIEI